MSRPRRPVVRSRADAVTALSSAREHVVAADRLHEVRRGAEREAAGALVEDRHDDDRDGRGLGVGLERAPGRPSRPARAAGCRARRRRAVAGARRPAPRRRPGDDDVVAAAGRGRPRSGRASSGRPRRPAPSRPCAGSTGGRRRRPARRASGSGTPNVLPSPTSLSTPICPPCSSTIRLHSVRPRPVPSSGSCARPPCWKESKMRSWSAGGMPTPVSATASTTRPASGAAETATVPPAGVNFTALDSRFSSTCLSRSSSASRVPTVGGRRRARA